VNQVLGDSIMALFGAPIVALYHAMDMAFWLPKAEAALVQISTSG